MNAEETEEQGYESGEEVAQEPHLTILQAFGLMILLLVLQLILAKCLEWFKLSYLTEMHWVGISLTHALSGLLTAQAGAILAGLSIFGLLSSGRFQFMLLLPLTIAGFGITILASELGNVLHAISPVPKEYVEFLNQLFNQNLWGVLFAVGVVAPVVEELIFRGVILDGLQIRYPARTALFVSSFLFGAIHIIPWAIINAFLLGLFFAWLRIKTRSLPLCIYIHSFYNSLPFLLSAYFPVNIPGFNNTPGEIVQFQPWWFDLLGVVLLALGIGGIRALYIPPLEESPQLQDTEQPG